MTSQRVLLIGSSDSGKTHFGIQLLGRLQHCPQSSLTSESSVADLTLFAAGLQALERGRLADHTTSTTHDEIKLTLRSQTGSRLELRWPEYAGEQIRDILNQRKVNAAWYERLRESTNWLLFIRPHQLPGISRSLDDIIARLQTRVDGQQAAATQENPPWRRWDENAKFVELLQILLHTSQRFALNRLRVPRLAIMLSCWDELEEAKQGLLPEALLEQYLPLVMRFIEANWEKESFSVWGLSSVGRALKRDESDNEFALRGPENEGYVITPSGSKQTDLTLPIQWLMDGSV